MINNAINKRVTESYFPGLALNEYVNWKSHTKCYQNMTHVRRNEQAKAIMALFSHEIDAWFLDPLASPIWNYKLGFSDYDKQQV